MELAGWLPLLLLVGLVVLQLGLGVLTAQQAGTASRAAARVASDSRAETDFRTAGSEAIFDWLERDGDVRIVKAEWGDEVTVTVRIKVPSVVPGIDDFGYAEKSATMPKD
jgi:hypothetical protein